MVDIFRAVCRTEVVDEGLLFLPDTVRAIEIREEQIYQGVQVNFDAMLGRGSDGEGGGAGRGVV